jgi:6-phospho-3-hexuloisomerase
MSYTAAQNSIVTEISATLSAVSETQVDALTRQIIGADRVFFVGVGRVLLSLQAVAKRLAHLGIDTVIVGQITEPAITASDLLIVGSGSGESAIPLAIAAKAKSHGAQVAHIGANPASSMSQYTDVFVLIPVQTKFSSGTEVTSVQPMTSLFEQCLLLLGDAIALSLIDAQGLDLTSLWQHHANLE